MNIQSAFFNGHSSYPDKRILYPDNPGLEEEAWIQGWNKAKYENDLDISNTGTDNFLWHYKTGE